SPCPSFISHDLHTTFRPSFLDTGPPYRRVRRTAAHSSTAAEPRVVDNEGPPGHPSVGLLWKPLELRGCSLRRSFHLGNRHRGGRPVRSKPQR
ncbi:unnamed protein product, partial [Ectocarpus fasciculatus]